MLNWIAGVDISSLEEEEKYGARYFEGGKAENLLSILGKNGINSARLRLWNDPFSKYGEAYGGGTNDLQTTIRLAKRIKEAGMEYLLDLQYSDFWADPGKQYKPKAWEDLHGKALEEAVYAYTREVLLTLRDEDALPDMVQVGNELSNGFLWPDGRVPQYDAIAELVNAGIRGVRSVKEDLPVMIHLDNGGNQALYREWFDHFMEKGDPFEVIGLSYYPFWHGTLEELEANLNMLAERYGKELILAETSTGFSLEDYRRYENLTPETGKGMAAKPELAEKVPYPMTPEGQKHFLEELTGILRRVPGGLGKGLYYWEGGWIPVPGCGWASRAGCDYIRDPGPGGNEWANQALFDYDGNALPALQELGLQNF